MDAAQALSYRGRRQHNLWLGALRRLFPKAATLAAHRRLLAVAATAAAAGAAGEGGAGGPSDDDQVRLKRQVRGGAVVMFMEETDPEAKFLEDQ